MPTLSPEQIYAVAVQAGFPPDRAVEFTAIALAESGGRTTVNAAGEEDSRGLWQINKGVHRDRFPGDLHDPLVNARAAFELSDGGRNLQPWTVTHEKNRGTPRDYRQYLDDAQAAAGASAATGAPSPAGQASASGLLVQPVAGAKLTDSWGDPRSGGRRHEGIDIMAKEGTPVRAIVGGTIERGFEGGENGGTVVRIEGDDGRDYYYAHLVEDSVDHLTVGQRVAAGAQIGAVGSTGNATADAPHLHLQIGEKGKKNEWVNPYDLLLDVPDEPGGSSGVTEAAFTMDSGAPVTAVDTDADQLTDEFEAMLGTDASKADSDADDLSDAYETTVSHTDPLSADTDADAVPDSVEVAQGDDAGTAALPAAAVQAGFAGAFTLDTDADDLSDGYEAQLGSDPTAADTDLDGLRDGYERALGGDLMTIDTDRDGLVDAAEARDGTLGAPLPGSAEDPAAGPTDHGHDHGHDHGALADVP